MFSVVLELLQNLQIVAEVTLRIPYLRTARLGLPYIDLASEVLRSVRVSSARNFVLSVDLP